MKAKAMKAAALGKVAAVVRASGEGGQGSGSEGGQGSGSEGGQGSGIQGGGGGGGGEAAKVKFGGDDGR